MLWCVLYCVCAGYLHARIFGIRLILKCGYDGFGGWRFRGVFWGGRGYVCGGGGYDIVGGFVWFGIMDRWMDGTWGF